MKKQFFIYVCLLVTGFVLHGAEDNQFNCSLINDSKEDLFYNGTIYKPGSIIPISSPGIASKYMIFGDLEDTIGLLYTIGIERYADPDAIFYQKHGKVYMLYNVEGFGFNFESKDTPLYLKNGGVYSLSISR